LKDAGFAQLVERDTTSYDIRLFAFDPRLSNVSDATAKADPSFWRPKPMTPKAEAAKPAPEGAAKAAPAAPTKAGEAKKAETKK
jgi:hypothetical protein